MMETYFAPPQRTERLEFKKQIDIISKSPVVSTLLKTMSGLLVIINENREIVALNHSFLKMLGIEDPETVLGLRLGESLNCIHSSQMPAGCGTSTYCSTCGAVIAMMASINENKADEQICAITIERNGIIENLCFIVRSQPVVLEENRWIFVFVQDITQEHFWVNLEKVFFHDIRNILTTLLGKVEMLEMDMPDNPSVHDITKTINRLNEEIKLQNTLSSQRTTQHLFRKANTTMSEIREDLELIIRNHSLLKHRRLEMEWPDQDMDIFTISLLVSRILGNMLLNALEASSDGDTVTLKTRVENETITWDVWNRTVIPEDIQKRIFQRHFSTKSEMGRGLGTYSMKLFGEKYLNGRVRFTSSPAGGTTFSLTVHR